VTSTDLHPDDLLDRELRGELSVGEHERLQSHLRECAVCRLERLAREDFREEEQDPAADVDARRLVSTLLVPTEVHEVLRRPVRPRMRHLRLALVAAATVSVAGWAAAARWSGARWTPSASSVRNPTDARIHAPAERAIHASGIPLSREADPPPEQAPQVDSAMLAPAPAPIAPRSSMAPRPSVAAPSRIDPVRASDVSVAPPPLASPPDASALFGRGSEARRLGDHARAAHFYRALLEDYPQSSEAHEALAVLGRMLLDDADAEGALRCFEQYLRVGGAVGGAVREDVMLGRALSLRRLGRTGEETRAWEDLVAQYPSSVHAERARRRLLDLERP
jgi:TolA-binding protein